MKGPDPGRSPCQGTPSFLSGRLTLCRSSGRVRKLCRPCPRPRRPSPRFPSRRPCPGAPSSLTCSPVVPVRESGVPVRPGEPSRLLPTRCQNRHPPADASPEGSLGANERVRGSGVGTPRRRTEGLSDSEARRPSEGTHPCRAPPAPGLPFPPEEGSAAPGDVPAPGHFRRLDPRARAAPRPDSGPTPVPTFRAIRPKAGPVRDRGPRPAHLSGAPASASGVGSEVGPPVAAPEPLEGP